MNILTQMALDIARSFVGVREVGGNHRGPEVEAWLACVGLPPGNAWCMAFAWCCVNDAFRSMELPNPIRPCGSVVRMWHSLPDNCKLTAPSPGVWAFHHDSANPALGHVGFIDELDPKGKGTYSVEGNTNSEARVLAEAYGDTRPWCARSGIGIWASRTTALLRLSAYRWQQAT